MQALSCRERRGLAAEWTVTSEEGHPPRAEFEGARGVSDWMDVPLDSDMDRQIIWE